MSTEAMFCTKAFYVDDSQKDLFVSRFNNELEIMVRDGWAVTNVVWSPDSSFVIVSLSRLVSVFPNGAVS